MKQYFLIFISTLWVFAACAQPKPIKLWQDVQGMKSQPTKMYIYPAPKMNNTGVAVIVFPGGSYSHTMGIATEGFGVAEWLNAQGINVFVVKYRTGNRGYHHPAMIQDAQCAIHYVRQHAKEYGINPDKVGTMGFSAGGHLVTMTGAFAKDNYIGKVGIKDRISLKPNFVVPVYPVVSMRDGIAHERSRRNLLTRHYTQDEVTQFSMELNIPADMPPTLVVTAKDDPVVKYENSVQLDRSLSKAKIPHKFLLYETGGHGYGMDESKAPEAGKWKYEFIKWLKEIKIL
ncbi:MAG: alpha/beta hydrolase [Bacteroidales bacterium]|nr:alpha/beta hydrolase [Bacteroidales bacterium]